MSPCFAPYCNSGYKGAATHAFRPDPNVADCWIQILSQMRLDTKFNPKNKNHRLCYLHFEGNLIIKEDKFLINGQTVTSERMKWKLSPGAIPTIFPQMPSYRQDLFTNGSTLNCDFCDKKFVLKSMLDRHLKVHQRVTESKWQCDICHIFLSTRTGLKQHKTKHTGEMPFECDVCHKKFRMSSVLRCHKVTHTKEKNHECNICGERFSLYSIMYRHWKRHKTPAGDGIYKCPIVSCFRVRFRRVYALKSHMKTHHPYTMEYDEVMARYKNIDDRSEYRKSRDKKPKDSKRVRKGRKTATEPEPDALEEEDVEEDERNDQEDDVGSDVQNEEDETGLGDTNGVSPYKRSARLAAKAKTRRKSKTKVQIKIEKSSNTSVVEKKYRPGPKSKTTKLKQEQPKVPETLENDAPQEENGVSAEEHSDLIIIKEEPVDNVAVSDAEGEEMQNE